MRCAPAVRRLERVTRRLTGGNRGVLDLAGLPSIELTVTGRKTGLPRTTALLYVPDGDAYLLVGSNWGNPTHPSWSANLLSTELAVLREGGERHSVKVRLLTGEEREQAWQRATKFWPGYVMEQRRAGTRIFRLFELRRLD